MPRQFREPKHRDKTRRIAREKLFQRHIDRNIGATADDFAEKRDLALAGGSKQQLVSERSRLMQRRDQRGGERFDASRPVMLGEEAFRSSTELPVGSGIAMRRGEAVAEGRGDRVNEAFGRLTREIVECDKALAEFGPFGGPARGSRPSPLPKFQRWDG